MRQSPLVHAERLALRLMIVVTIALAACSHRPPPASFASYELRGTVVEVNAERLRVRHKSGHVVELLLDDRTTVISQEGAATLSALTHGRRVIVNVEPLTDGRARAARVRVFGAA